MEDKKLKIALIEDDKKNSESIMALFTMHKKFVDKVEKIHTKNELFQKIESDNINTVVINIFSFGISKGIEIIEKISKEKNERPIPVCLLGTKKQLASFEDVPANWIIKFKHYCKMATDESIEMLNEDIKDMSRSLLGCLKTMSKKISLEKEINLNKDKEVSNEKLLELNKVESEIISMKYENIKQNNHLIPGINEEALPVVIRKTLEQTYASIEHFKWANFAIIGFGLIVVLISISYSMEPYQLTKTGEPIIRYDILAFGGFGLAGIIATLITNPTKSIGQTARQMIHIQISYLGYLKQVEVIEGIKTNGFEEEIKKSEHLENVTNSLQKTLCECFHYENNQKQQTPKKDNNETT